MSAQPRIVADGLRFPEGPTWLGDGTVAVAEMQGESVAVIDAGGGVRRPGDLGGGPNGTAAGAGGELYVANNGGLSAAGRGFWHAPRQFDGCVQRVDPDGTVTTVAADLPGPAPHRPNDLLFAPDGTLIVTDSADWEQLPNVPDGRVLGVAADGAVSVLAQLPAMPNGLAFAPDGTTLYVAQSLTRRILACDYRDGALGEPRTVIKLPSGMPDGLCVAGDGRLLICGSVGGAVFVVDPSGEVLDTIEAPEGSQPTNCCIGDDGTLYVTFSVAGQLAAYDLELPPLALATGTVAAAIEGSVQA
jgi:gluconolactonase